MASLKHPFLQNLSNDKPFLIEGGRTYSYAMLVDSINAALMRLQDIPSGSVIGIIGDYDMPSIAMLLACVERSLIVAPLPKNECNPHDIESSPLYPQVKEGQIDYIYMVDSLNANSYYSKPTCHSERSEESIKDTSALPQYDKDSLIPTQISESKHTIIKTLQDSQSSGLLIFSSGSTGKPKAIVHNLETLIKNYLYKTENPLKIISAYLPDHIAGIDVLLSTLGSGGTLIVPKSRMPKDILESIQTHKAEILPASPTLLRLLLLADMDTYNLKSLKLIVYGSERMSDTLLTALQEKLPFVRFKQSFGTSETSAIRTKGLDSKKGFIKILSDYKIINNELFIRSNTQALGYLNSDNSVFDNGYFATGDIVEAIDIDGEEYLRIVGRAKEVINVGGEKVLPQEVEGVLLEMPQISDCLVYGESNAITGQSVSVKVVVDYSKIDSKNTESKFSESTPPTSPLELKKLIRSFCKDKLAPFKIPTKAMIVESLEVSERFKKVRK